MKDPNFTPGKWMVCEDDLGEFVENESGDIDPLHPNGRCRCAGEGQCEWCQRTEARDELDGIAEVLDEASVPQGVDGPDGRRWTLGLGARVEHVIAERDEARAEVERLRAALAKARGEG